MAIELVIPQRRRDLGGFEVGRVLPFARRRMVGPFIFFDRMGPVDFPQGLPESVDVRPHPHIGLATLTYLFEGEIMHRDSVGSEQAIRPAEVNWMTAGRGITHSERFERARREGGRMDGIQAWVALPREHEEDEPAFSHHARLPQFEQDGVRIRLIAGSAMGHESPVPVRSPLFYLHCDFPAEARTTFSIRHPERALYLASGALESNGTSYESGQMLVFTPGADLDLRAVSAATVILLGGEPVGERFIEWNFVSSSRERIRQAKEDWRAGRMRMPVDDDRECIPLPADAAAAPNPMS